MDSIRFEQYLSISEIRQILFFLENNIQVIFIFQICKLIYALLLIFILSYLNLKYIFLKNRSLLS